MSYVRSLYHCVWSTKERRPFITPELEERLWKYMGGIARKNKMKVIAIGGVEDHIHVLLSLHQTVAVAKAIQLIKGGSSKWVHEEFPDHRTFEWQVGYGAFSIGISQTDDTVRYIGRQKDHHAAQDYKSEFLLFLEKNQVEYDPRYVWD